MKNRMKHALVGAALALGVAGGVAAVQVASPPAAVAAVGCESQAKVTGGPWLGYYQGMCPCEGWRGNKFTWWKPGAKEAAQGEVNWHKSHTAP